MSLLQGFVTDAAGLGVALTESDAARMFELLDELERWNRAFSLTAITERSDMIRRHLLDSLSLGAHLRGTTIADVGTGAGFPGLPLAIANPSLQVSLIDSNGKKTRFVAHAARKLGLANVEVVHARVESIRPEKPFDTVAARAFAPLPEFLPLVSRLCGPETRVLAMKGRRPDEEIAAIPRGWHVAEVAPLMVPGLTDARCVVVLQRRAN